jgi:hypothetical protein
VVNLTPVVQKMGTNHVLSLLCDLVKVIVNVKPVYWQGSSSATNTHKNLENCERPCHVIISNIIKLTAFTKQLFTLNADHIL